MPSSGKNTLSGLRSVTRERRRGARSSASPLNTGARSRPSRVRSVNCTHARSRGSTQRHSARRRLGHLRHRIERRRRPRAAAPSAAAGGDRALVQAAADVADPGAGRRPSPLAQHQRAQLLPRALAAASTPAPGTRRLPRLHLDPVALSPSRPVGRAAAAWPPRPPGPASSDAWRAPRRRRIAADSRTSGLSLHQQLLQLLATLLQRLVDQRPPLQLEQVEHVVGGRSLAPLHQRRSWAGRCSSSMHSSPSTTQSEVRSAWGSARATAANRAPRSTPRRLVSDASSPSQPRHHPEAVPLHLVQPAARGRAAARRRSPASARSRPAPPGRPAPASRAS